MYQRITVNPLDVLLWNSRHSGKDIVNIYSKFSPMMQIGADTKMLNFGLWKNSTTGSGFCIPATIWKKKRPDLDIFCMDLNYSELKNGSNHVISQINSSSTMIPFSDKSFDRIIALESAQHFAPLGRFFQEAKRILTDNGKLVLAIPVTNNHAKLKLGILNITWLSKKYTESHIKDTIKNAGFSLKKEESIGKIVYEPFADFYIHNRKALREKLVSTYSDRIENLVFKSMKKMKELSEKKIIDYLLLSLE
ncbi:MAG: methyltransferase domain-containing protein [Nitrosopumilaceae archaeon]|nr:methyltransferase domain-containing protein [Nitrosopumilaceae archaeon]